MYLVSIWWIVDYLESIIPQTKCKINDKYEFSGKKCVTINDKLIIMSVVNLTSICMERSKMEVYSIHLQIITNGALPIDCRRCAGSAKSSKCNRMSCRHSYHTLSIYKFSFVFLKQEFRVIHKETGQD